MIESIILSVVFLAFALGALLFFIFSNNKDKKLKTFYIASSAVYCSGTILITILSIFIEKLTMKYVIILEIAILIVYIFDTYMLRVMAFKLADLTNAAKTEKEKAIADNSNEE